MVCLSSDLELQVLILKVTFIHGLLDWLDDVRWLFWLSNVSFEPWVNLAKDLLLGVFEFLVDSILDGFGALLKLLLCDIWILLCLLINKLQGLFLLFFVELLAVGDGCVQGLLSFLLCFSNKPLSVFLAFFFPLFKLLIKLFLFFIECSLGFLLDGFELVVDLLHLIIIGGESGPLCLN